MFSKFSPRLSPLAVLVVFVSAGCATTGDLPNALSTQQELSLGAELSEQVEQQEKILQNAAIQQYVRSIGQELARRAPRQDVGYQFTVIDAPDTINAFALPGGHLYIYTGLMKICANEAQLASVMAHEIAHVAAYHHGETFTRQYQMSMLTSIALGENPGAAAQLVAQLASQFGSLKFSRDQEREADAIGMQILYEAGYRPDSMVNFMQRMLTTEAGSPRPLAFFSSHPATEARIDYLTMLVSQYPVEVREGMPVHEQRYKQQVLSVLR